MNVVSVAIPNYYIRIIFCIVMQLACKRRRFRTFSENWKEYHTRMKPILKIMEDKFKKDVEQGILLQGLTDLITSNTESISKLINYNTSALTSALTTKKSEASPSP